MLILDQGEEVFKTITEFANRQGISGASVSAVGAFAEARVGWFDLAAKTWAGKHQEEATQARDLVAQHLSSNDLAAAQDRSAKWLADHQK